MKPNFSITFLKILKLNTTIIGLVSEVLILLNFFSVQNFEKISSVTYFKQWCRSWKEFTKSALLQPDYFRVFGYCFNMFDKVLYFRESVKVLCYLNLLLLCPNIRGWLRLLSNICNEEFFTKLVFSFYFCIKVVS